MGAHHKSKPRELTPEDERRILYWFKTSDHVDIGKIARHFRVPKEIIQEIIEMENRSRVAEAEKGKKAGMRLMLSIPMDDPSVGPEGILQERAFACGPINITALSVIANQCDGYAVLSYLEPPIIIRLAVEPWRSFAEPPINVPEFEKEFAHALKSAQEHAANVKNWIETEIRREIIRQYGELNK